MHPEDFLEEAARRGSEARRSGEKRASVMGGVGCQGKPRWPRHRCEGWKDNPLSLESRAPHASPNPRSSGHLPRGFLKTPPSEYRVRSFGFREVQSPMKEWLVNTIVCFGFVLVAQSRPTLCDPHGLWPTRLLCT